MYLQTRASEQHGIKQAVYTLEASIQEAKAKIKHIQEYKCSHPNATKEYKADTGNYSKSDDRYWIDYSCPDCGKHWSKDQ